MQTRSQTAAAASNITTMIDKINDDVLRKTKLLRTPSTINKNPRLPTQPFTIRTRASTRAAELKRLEEFRSTLITKKPKYQVEIDFDEATRKWNKNKIRLGNGVYKYKQ